MFSSLTGSLPPCPIWCFSPLWPTYLNSHSITSTTGTISNLLFFCTYWLSHHFFIYKLTRDIPGFKCQKPSSPTNPLLQPHCIKAIFPIPGKSDSLIFVASASVWGDGACVWPRYYCACQKHNNGCALRWGRFHDLFQVWCVCVSWQPRQHSPGWQAVERGKINERVVGREFLSENSHQIFHNVQLHPQKDSVYSDNPSRELTL